MKEKPHPVFIQVQDSDGFIRNIFWRLATPEQQALWLAEQKTGHGGDISAKGKKPGHGKNQRKMKRGGLRFH